MKTYMSMWFNSNGERPSRVIEKLREIGFQPIKGNYDFVYDWARDVGIGEVLTLSDEVQRILNGCGVIFKLETI